MERQNHSWIEGQAACAAGGFRLQRLEVYNWGTFNHRIWPMTPAGGTALLTGANGSGKSTLVDALLTLFVPFNRRTYNQASGTEKHRERNEGTYVRGAWSKQRDSDGNTTSIRYLRDRDSYSVLLGVFHNMRTEQYVSLACIYWWQQGELRKFFVVATRPLNIATHFAIQGDMATWRRQFLKIEKVEVFEEFARYSRRFCALLGLRSEKALDLFNQIVSIKDIGGLNAFVREHMLEKSDAQQRITELRENFENLTKAHAAIELAERQLVVLEPLIKDANEYEKLLARIAEADRCSQIVPVYIAGRRKIALEEAMAAARVSLDMEQKRSAALESSLEQLNQQRIDLHVAIQNDRAGQRLQQLDRDIKTLAQRQSDKEAQAAKYNAYVRHVGLPAYSDEATFYKTRQRATALQEQVAVRLETLVAQRDAQIRSEGDLGKEIQQLEQEWKSLQERESQIPREDIELRLKLARALNIPEKGLPFVGELLRVRANAQRWEAAIERLLHGFGRQLLVPEQYYVAVSHYVDATNLNGRLVYHRVSLPRTARNTGVPERNMLVNKLEVKPGTHFTGWLAAEIIDYYDYLCCETMEEFHQARRALTVKGQVKHTTVRHEKNDRSRLGDRKEYVLGWSNEEKLAAIRDELAKLNRAMQQVKDAIRRIDEERRAEDGRRVALEQLLAFDSFDAIDWFTDERNKRSLELQKRELAANANQLAGLQRQLDAVNQEYERVAQEKNSAISAITTLNNTLQAYAELHQACVAILQAAAGESLAQDLALIEKEHKATELTIKNADDVREKIIQFYHLRANALRGTLNQLSLKITGQMNDLKRVSTAALQDVDASLDALGEYRRLYEQVRRDDLPRYRKRFKELLDETVIYNINAFKVGLETQVDNIEASITSLNESLRVIDYTPSTYIQLCYSPTRDSEIRDFRAQLRACLPDVAQPRTTEANEESFQRIQALIHRFEQEDRWTAKVTDVRHWLDFSAEERYREDETVKNYYSDSSGKSGGQKTKLAYTILASAIAYQYGLDQKEGQERAFRFVVIDEAFVRSDEINARYAMELFKQLDLQLLVVTPLDKIHVIEPYISACHYVTNNEEESDSKVYDLTIAEYYEQKELLQAGVKAGDYAR